MLNTFPSLLTYMFFAPTLLRIAAALVVLGFAWEHWKNMGELQKLLAPILGEKMVTPIAWIYILVETAVAVILCIGLYTQIAALIGAILAIKSAIARAGALAPFGRVADGLLFVICISLLLTGAGALAFDVPL